MAVHIVAFLLMSAAGGTAASKGTTKVREFFNEGETVNVACYACKNNGPHKFNRIDRSWGASAAVGMAGGAIGGTIAGVTAKRLFRCRACNVEVYESGKAPSWNFDRATQSFVQYPEMEQAYVRLQGLLARNQHLAADFERRLREVEALRGDERANHAETKRLLEALLRDVEKAAA